MKNLVLCCPNRQILYLSETYEGAVHDKTIADEADFQFTQMMDVLQDTGFQGFQPKNTTIIQPMKKPKGKQFTEEQKEKNRNVSKERVVVEQAIGGIKIWRTTKEVCRSWLHHVRDLVMLLACGLHNFRTARRA